MILGLALLGAGGRAAAQDPSETAIGLSLERVATGKEALAIRGSSLESEPPRFSAAATLRRIPCAGSYRYELQSEDQQTGALSSYAARVTLLPTASDPATPCGGAPPSGRGALRISIWGEEETIVFKSESAKPAGSGSFFGTFTIGTQPVCDRPYTLAVDADVGSWNRSVRYRFKVDRWGSRAQGLPLENDSC